MKMIEMICKILLKLLNKSLVKSTINKIQEVQNIEINIKLEKEKVDITLPERPFIRGKIHQKIVERFGEKALYYLGLEQFNFTGVEENFFFLPHVNFKNKFTFKNFKTYGFKKKQRNIWQR